LRQHVHVTQRRHPALLLAVRARPANFTFFFNFDPNSHLNFNKALSLCGAQRVCA
jgi:hypothetical protein